MPLLGREKVTFELKEGIKSRVNNNLKGVYLSGLGNIIAGTPADKGIHRNSWFLTVGVASNSTTTSENKTGASSIRQLAKMPAVVLGKKLYFTNNAPAISILEYGGFPTPVKQGSYIKESKSYQILSIRGFSKQAPNGWVRATLIAMQNKIRSL
tara:strand:- start:6418 stop:6879 length:462 start_codon:yes stop_codon:yes gene_type:complete